ncbi:MAG: glycosyltransferase family 2 protein [Phenylobacterium sp.]|nr:glycosyltransferase family 2 protein [Alphaproteobacteria bacterium]MBU4039010.1 glycosyltransferase family 2 protein [Alphaproteobacteria bacterium]MBU4138198.1 glycosyltransferase family 2 protein [Alphaproteobacteria bacterium]MDZ4374916.1 glycosyltransferase family 2 protein [Phenylobacterium sp.]
MNRSTAPQQPAPEISVVIPCFNEEDNVAAIAGAVAGELAALNADYEIIFIDNASTDDTVERIMKLCDADRRIKLIANNRNYGQMRSPTHGIYQAGGRAVIAMCADFQDPPALIGRFVTRWREGAAIVLGVRASEKTSASLGLARRIAYGFLGQFADYQVIPGATGFGVYDRRVVDTLARWNEPEPFFRGMLVESGFPIEIIPYDRPLRAAGRSKNNFATLFSFALSGLASSSRNLLRLPFYAAAAMLGLVGLTFVGLVWAWVAGTGVGLWLIALLIELCALAAFVFLGLIGEQIRLIAERGRNTPLVVEKARVNF